MRGPGMDMHQIARELNAALGLTLVAALAGTKDRKQPIRWARPGAEPSPQYVARLKFAHEEWTRLVACETEHIASSWFIGGNPRLNEDTPLTAILEDRRVEVAAAVTSFLEGF